MIKLASGLQEEDLGKSKSAKGGGQTDALSNERILLNGILNNIIQHILHDCSSVLSNSE